MSSVVLFSCRAKGFGNPFKFHPRLSSLWLQNTAKPKTNASPSRKLSSSSSRSNKSVAYGSSFQKQNAEAMTALLGVSLFAAGYTSDYNQRNTTTTTAATVLCQQQQEDENKLQNPFETESIDDEDDSGCLEYDHYNGVTLHLQKWKKNSCSPQEFEQALQQALQSWKKEGRKGIWIHIPKSQADKVPIAIQLGFDFHMIGSSANTNKNDRAGNELIVSQWLPDTDENRLPDGPSHQIGVGCVVFHPTKPDHVLMVQEKTGPAAAYDLWKMPTGLVDPGEDLHQAAIRELKEETGLDATFDGILTFRHAHPGKIVATQQSNNSNKDNNSDNKKTATSSRKVSDIFFVCQMTLQPHHVKYIEEHMDDIENADHVWDACPHEIAKIQWMPIEDFCNQAVWQRSPSFIEMNKAILYHTQQHLFHAYVLPLRFPDKEKNQTVESIPHNTFYKSKI